MAPKHHFTVLEPLALNNPRVVPQQSVSSVTNIEDIEAYLMTRERQVGKQYLRVIDLPASERNAVMQELSVMGITAGSLFPGIDGVCKQVRERFSPHSKKSLAVLVVAVLLAVSSLSLCASLRTRNEIVRALLIAAFICNGR